jgi:hypothetical protein
MSSIVAPDALEDLHYEHLHYDLSRLIQFANHLTVSVDAYAHDQKFCNSGM